MRGYRKSLLDGRVGRLEKISRHVFDLQDTLLKIRVMEAKEECVERVASGPAEANPKRTAVVGTGPAGLCTAIMLARCSRMITVASRASGMF
jgi:NADPH-dependent glutamate synthase beta subunit-like oxidoreductase